MVYRRILQLTYLTAVLMFRLAESGFPSPFQSITSTVVQLDPSINASDIYVCYDAMQIDMINSDLLLLGICTLPAAGRAGSIANLPINDLQGTLIELAGNVTGATLAAGDWDTPQYVHKPQYLQQAVDKIRFIDDTSCAREMDRSTKRVTTIIGRVSGGGTLTCGEGTLDVTTNSDKFAYGLVYDEITGAWYFPIVNDGLYGYYPDGSGGFTKTELIQRAFISSGVTDTIRQIYLHNGYIWHKVRYGLNRYVMSSFNSSVFQISQNNNTFLRFLSSTGTLQAPDPKARYQYTDENLRIGDSDADMSMAPDDTTLMIADSNIHRVFFLNTLNGSMNAVCGITTPVAIDSTDETTCTFVDITAAVWLDQYKVLVYEKIGNRFRTIQFLDLTTNTATSTSATLNTTTSKNTTTPKSKGPNLGWIGGVIGGCSPLWVMLSIWLTRYCRCCKACRSKCCQNRYCPCCRESEEIINLDNQDGCVRCCVKRGCCRMPCCSCWVCYRIQNVSSKPHEVELA